MASKIVNIVTMLMNISKSESNHAKISKSPVFCWEYEIQPTKKNIGLD